jgi:tRNA G18 (ribose-2'-O)-methylase SpoU
MLTIDVDDRTDPRLADYQRLTDVSLRMRTEPEHGLFIAESRLVIERAIRGGYALRSALVAPEWLRSLEGLVADDVPVYVASAELLKEVTGYHVHRGALASVARRPLVTVEEAIAGARRIAVLEDVNTHTNVGAIFRSVAALGLDAALLSPACADPLYRRSVRVSMGAVFSVPYARFESWPGGLEALRDNGFRILALHPAGMMSLAEVQLAPQDKAAILLGSEGPGLTPAALAYAEGVRIPMAGGIDSLNVAAAAAVACYALGRS